MFGRGERLSGRTDRMKVLKPGIIVLSHVGQLDASL